MCAKNSSVVVVEGVTYVFMEFLVVLFRRSVRHLHRWREGEGVRSIRIFGWCFIAFSGRKPATVTIGDESPWDQRVLKRDWTVDMGKTKLSVPKVAKIIRLSIQVKLNIPIAG